MKIKGLHPEHRHRRLIEEFHKSYKVPVVIFIIFYVIFFGWLISPIFQTILNIINGHIVLSSILYSYVKDVIIWIINISCNNAINSILINGGITVIIWILPLLFINIMNKYLKKYSAELITFWVDRLLKDNWIFYLLDLNLFDQISMPETTTRKLAIQFYLSGSKPASAIKYRFLEYFNTQRYQTISQKLLKLHPLYAKNKLIKMVADDMIVIFLKFIPIYFATSTPIILLATFLGVFHSNWFLTIPIIVVLVGLWLYFIPGLLFKQLFAKWANLAALKAIFTALYLRDPDHEITDQSVLGIPAYINYKSLVQLVDSYMIDSKPSSGVDQQ